MSFLVRDTDERATLEATLAFLDAWDVPGTDSSGADSPVDAPARCQTPQQKQQATRRKKPRRKYPNSSSTALQRRKKAEILALRTQVELLELQLEQLQKVPAGASATYLLQLEHVGVQPTTWAQQAAVEYRGRLEAEQTNHKLKSIMANQVKVNEALRTLLQKTSVLEGMDFLQPDPCRPLSMELSGMELLERKVERLYFDADVVFQPQAAAAISVQATEKHSPSLGKTMEFVSNTPMQCPLRVASDTLWKWFSLNKALRNRPNILERNYTLLLESQMGTLEFRKQNFVRRFEEKDRVIVIWADILHLPKYKLKFCNHAWMFITPSADAPKDASVIRTFQRLFLDYEHSHMTQSVPFAQETAFRELCKLYRRFLQSQQSKMMEETFSAAMVQGFTV